MSTNFIRIVIVLATLLIIFIGRQAIAEPYQDCNSYESLKDYAQCEVTKRWGNGQWESFEIIIQKESRWKVTGAHNPKLSSASGLGGLLDSTWKLTGYKKTDDPRLQILAAIEYISIRYKLPSKALEKHTLSNWY